MIRSVLIAPVFLVVAACASTPLALEVIASTDVPEMTDEVECMTDCLDDNTENCESCASRCLFRGPESIASNF